MNGKDVDFNTFDDKVSDRNAARSLSEIEKNDSYSKSVENDLSI